MWQYIMTYLGIWIAKGKRRRIQIVVFAREFVSFNAAIWRSNVNFLALFKYIKLVFISYCCNSFP